MKGLDNLSRRIILLITRKYKLRFGDVFLRSHKINLRLTLCKDEICYILREDYHMSYRYISKELKYNSKSSCIFAVRRHCKRNGLPSPAERTSPTKELQKFALMFYDAYRVDPEDALTVLRAVYNRGYQAGYTIAKRPSRIDLNRGGATLVPVNENNASVTSVGRPRGLLNEGDHEEIKPPSRSQG